MADEYIKQQSANLQTMAGVVLPAGTDPGAIRNIRCDDDGNLAVNVMEGEIILTTGGTPELYAGAVSSGTVAVAFSATSNSVLIDNPSTTQTLTLTIGGVEFVIAKGASLAMDARVSGVSLKASGASTYQIVAVVA